MLDTLNPDRTERILLLFVPEHSELLRLAARVPDGLVVCLGADALVREARKAVRECANVMLIPASPDEIPWHESFFTLVVAHSPDSAAWEREVRRVLAPAGRILTA